MNLDGMTALSWLYGSGARLKNFLYEAGFADSLKLDTPVISIGNLTVGGTGKTPITQLILDYYAQASLKAAVVGRNYKAQVKGNAKVDPTKNMAAQYFGDEPTLIAQRNPDVSVFVGPKKWSAAFQAEQVSKPDVIVVDDGFQHRALYRDLDLVLLDVTVPIGDYQMLPKGKSRESLESLARADYVLLTKVNLTQEENIEQIKAMIPADKKVIEVSYRLGGVIEEAGAKAIGFAGLAKPESFKTSILQDTLYELLDFVPFPDHHAFTHQDIERLVNLKNEKGADVILLTEKDWVKVRNLIGDHKDFRPLQLQTHFLESVEEFYASLDKVVRQGH